MAEDELEKMTAPELRELALKEHPEITGVHAMKKEDLVAAIHQARGDAAQKKKAGTGKTGLKKQIRELKAEKQKLRESKDKVAASRLRKKIKRLKRLTKKAA